MYTSEYLLDCVLLCDALREPSLLREVVGRCLMVSLKPDLVRHLLKEMKHKRLPSASLLYDARINLDMCSMLYARQYLFNEAVNRQHPWVCHVRCDSSPQFGRGYLVTQVDYVLLGENYIHTSITKRLMPLQCVGSRSGSAAHKLEKIKFCIGLESDDIAFTADRVCSILTDFGTESCLWFTPSSSSGDGLDVDDVASAEDLLMFKYGLPLPDADHALHHVMLCITEHFAFDEQFHDQLNAVSRWFSNRDRCDRFIAKCILQNTNITNPKLKSSFAAMYRSTCPTLVTTRWSYLYDVLEWLIPRQQSLTYLLTDIKSRSGKKHDNFAEFTEKEMNMIEVVADPSNKKFALFWASCCLSFQLAKWGAEMSSFFHSCPISSHDWSPLRSSCSNCCWKGRLGSKLAQGVWLDKFSKELLNLPVSGADTWLEKLPQDKKQWLIQEFQASKVKMAQRFLQVFESGDSFPGGFWLCRVYCSVILTCRWTFETLMFKRPSNIARRL